MAMQLGPGAADDEPILDINTTPLIDVMLVLLVMLIITIPIQLHAVNLNMPVGKPPVQAVPPEVIRIDIDAQDRLWWQGEPLADRAELEARLTAALATTPQPEVHLRPQADAHYATFAAVMVSANRLGATKLGVVGGEQFLRAPGATR